MRQLLAFSMLTSVAVGLVCLYFACGNSAKCRDLSGHWTTQEGQDLVFLPEGKALWLTRFGSRYDTTQLQYRLNCSAEVIDLHDFCSGPHASSTLYGILEWSSDTSFRLRYEPGSQDDVRPATFDHEQSIQFVRVK
jgi:hypothetical protein